MNPISLFLLESNEEKKFRERSEVIIIKDDKILVGVRKNGKFMLPGGGIGKNEAAKDAAKREATEEIKVNCKDPIRIGGPITIKWPDIYGGEKDIVDEEHKKWLEKQQLMGHINNTFQAKFSSYSESNIGPQDDKYKRKLIDPQEYINQLEKENTEIEDEKRQWRIKWNNYTIECLKKIQKNLEKK